MKNIKLVLLVAILSTALATSITHLFNKDSEKVILKESNTPAVFASQPGEQGNYPGLDFTYAAEKTTEAVVHIKSTVSNNVNPVMPPNPFREFFGEDMFPRQPRESQASGSGVLIAENGYIVTNNHVVDRSNKLEVTLNDNRTFEATLIGTDPSTDLAVIKIDEEDLPYVAFANSDQVKVGSWVLAVGNPFNLASTVTAGIVSAKARNINILRDNYAIESFIQTDAAINRGNSGGALVDLNGDLIGINTAIATPTGTYTGYAFAVPSNIVQKVTQDLIEYGTVQRGFLGVMIRNVNPMIADDQNLGTSTGVLVDSLTASSAAAQAGIQKGDVIIAVDGAEVKSSPELQEKVGRKRPGEEVKITVLRNGNEKDYRVVLNNKNGSTEYLAKVEKPALLADLGISVSELSLKEKEELKISNGVKIERIGPGKVRRFTSIAPGFIVLKVNKKEVKDTDHFLKMIENEEGGVMLEGIYPGKDGEFYYAFGK
ncbi:MAG: Do family serine endopeptidase [Cytophagales bacterium]